VRLNNGSIGLQVHYGTENALLYAQLGPMVGMHYAGTKVFDAGTGVYLGLQYELEEMTPAAFDNFYHAHIDASI
jgi:hypothetical protein